jgi:NADPH:quinone reductase-like Zn-dependent oxidoreductase
MKGTTMKAITLRRYGSPDDLRFQDVDVPVPSADQVLVRVCAASVNARDWHVMRGDPFLARLMPGDLGLTGPRSTILGTDFAGVVEVVGANVTHLAVGDEVYGEANGAFAEYVCSPAGAVDRKPANITFEQAAAVPLAGNTALGGLREGGRVRTGQRVLINGASGGVGLFAVQIGKALGAEVTGVCSNRNVDLVRSAGADHVVDYTSEDFAAADRRYDVIFDLVGNRSLADLRRALTPDGTLVLSGGGVSAGRVRPVGPMGLILRGMAASKKAPQRVVVFEASQRVAHLAALRDLIESGAVTPVIDRTYPLREAAEAVRYLELEHARAKVVLTV